MKKTILAATLAAFSIAASATTVFVAADYDNANAGQAIHSQYEVATGAALTTKLGQVDAAIVARRIRATNQDDGLGFEIGYSNGLQVGPVAVTGRVGYGRINQLQTNGGGFSGNIEYYSLAAQGTVPVTKGINAFASFRHRNGLEADTPSAANRYAVGLNVSPIKNVLVTGAVTHTRQAGIQFNGVSVTTSYAF